MAPEQASACVRGCCRSEGEGVRLDLASSDIKVLRVLASGAESDVCEGEFNGAHVAVKKPRLTSRDDTDRFHSELGLLCQFRHPSIAEFLGARAHPPDYALLFKLYLGGSLHDALHIRGWDPSLQHSLQVALDLGEALEYIHERGVAHRDVKPGNVLLDEFGRAALTDFGLALTAQGLEERASEKWRPQGRPTGGFHKKKIVGTTQYMAPEVLRKQGHSLKSDVYSFGITLNELLTRIVPYADCTTAAQPHTVLEMAYTEQQLIAGITAGGLRPVLFQPPTCCQSPSNGPSGEAAGTSYSGPMDAPCSNCPAGGCLGAESPKLPALVASCWDDDAARRPSMSEVTQTLRSLLHTCKRSPAPSSGVCGSNGERAFAEAKTKLWWLQRDELSQKNKDKQSELGDKQVQGSSPSRQLANGPGNSIDGDATGLEPGHALLDLARSGSGYRPVLSAGWFASMGGRESMEDAHCQAALLYAADQQEETARWAGRGAQRNAAPPLPPGWSLSQGVGGRGQVADSRSLGRGTDASLQVHMFGVFDGHRGAEAAEYAAAHLPSSAAANLTAGSSVESALKAAFLETDRGLRTALDAQHSRQLGLRQARPGATQPQNVVKRYPGCAAALAVIVGDRIFVANAGDCRTVLCTAGKARALSKDDLASDAEERARLLQAGAEVSWRVNTWRVGSAGIEVSRSLGDHDLKPAVTAEPQVVSHVLSPDDEFLVMASDGIWSVLSNDEVVLMIKETVKEPTMAAKRLVMAAAEKRSNDNITALVLFLQAVNTVERIY